MSEARTVEEAPPVTGYSCTVECYTNEPWSTPALFQLIREQARYYGMPEIGRIFVTLRVEVSGSLPMANPPGLKEKLDQLWLGEVEVEPRVRKADK